MSGTTQDRIQVYVPRSLSFWEPLVLMGYESFKDPFLCPGLSISITMRVPVSII